MKMVTVQEIDKNNQEQEDGWFRRRFERKVEIMDRLREIAIETMD